MEDFLLDIPTQVSTKEPLFGLDMHPKRDIVAYSSAAGTIHVQEYLPNTATKPLMNLTHHVKSCRSVLFSPGEDLFSCSSDKSIVGIDLETRKTIFDQKKAHKSAINTMLLHENLIFTGDEDGVIKVWDQRKPEKVKEITENSDYISAFTVNSDRNTLLATSGDSTLTVVDIRSGKSMDRSIEQDDELLSLALIKDGKKVVCGGSTGHLDSIDCMVPVDENTIITGCGDGIIRIVSILPNKIVGVITAQNEDDSGITSMAVSHDRKFLAACIDTTLQFWNVSILYDDDGEKEEGVEEEEDQIIEDGVEPEEDGDGDGNGEGDGQVGEDGAEEDFEDELTPTSESDSSDDDSGSDSDSYGGFIQRRPPTDGKKGHKQGKRFDPAKAAFFGDL